MQNLVKLEEAIYREQTEAVPRHKQLGRGLASATANADREGGTPREE